MCIYIIYWHFNTLAIKQFLDKNVRYSCLKKIMHFISEFWTQKRGDEAIQIHFVLLSIYEERLRNCVITNPLYSKKNINQIQGYAFEIFRVTFIVEHTK